MFNHNFTIPFKKIFKIPRRPPPLFTFVFPHLTYMYTYYFKHFFPIFDPPWAESAHIRLLWSDVLMDRITKPLYPRLVPFVVGFSSEGRRFSFVLGKKIWTKPRLFRPCTFYTHNRSHTYLRGLIESNIKNGGWNTVFYVFLWLIGCFCYIFFVGVFCWKNVWFDFFCIRLLYNTCWYKMINI